MVIYSREAFTLLYGKVYALFRLIRSGEFDPDESVEKRILSVAEHYVQNVGEDFEHGKPEDISSSESSSLEDEVNLPPQSVSADVKHHLRSPFPEGNVERCFVHRVSGIGHLKKVLSDLTCQFGVV